MNTSNILSSKMLDYWIFYIYLFAQIIIAIIVIVSTNNTIELTHYCCTTAAEFPLPWSSTVDDSHNSQDDPAYWCSH